MTQPRKIILVTRRTRLDELIERHNTTAQARFHVARLGGDFADYQREHEVYGEARRAVLSVLERHGRYQVLDRAMIPNFVFGPDDIAVTLGQDGLAANVLKYLGGRPLIALNPDRDRHDGVLLPFVAGEFGSVLSEVLAGRRAVKTIRMAEARTSDRQRLLAINDLFIGPRGHTSLRYEIALDQRHEIQSSSGLIVATGLGSTAWIKSIVTGSRGLVAALGDAQPEPIDVTLPWDSDVLQFAVREPFPSRTTQAGLVYGRVAPPAELHLRSMTGEDGIVFSDGIATDSLVFSAGMEITIATAAEVGHLVI